MELKAVFQIIKKKLWLFVLLILIAESVTGILTVKQKESYETSSIITIQPNRENTEQYQYGGFYSIQAADLFCNTIMGWVKTENIVIEIYKKSGIALDESKVKSLGKKIYIQKMPPQNLVLKISSDNKETSRILTENTINLIKEKNSQMAIVTNSNSNFEIINSELITTTVKPNMLFNLMITFIASFLLCLILVFFLEYFSRTINTVQKLKQIFGIKPVSLRGVKLKSLANQESKEAEKFRFIRANIYNNEEKFALIVAGLNNNQSIPLVSSNIALSFARSGKKTVLIDANFSNPTIHDFFVKENNHGFSEFLFDVKNLEKYLQKTEDVNLKIMSAGIKLSYASDTIERADLKSIIDELFSVSDVVIINVPTLNSSSEAFPLFNVIRKSLIVVRLGKSSISAAKFANSFLDKKEVEKNILVI